jgi:uncharacterized DUF497 family protein
MSTTDNNGSDNSTGENCLGSWDKGKKRQNSAERQVQELEEAEEFERKAAEARAAAEEALSPEEREERRRAEEADSLVLVQWLQAYKDETRHRIQEALKSVMHTETLCRLISERKATDHEKAETMELLGQGESPNTDDVVDEELNSGDESTDPEADPKEVEGMKKWKQGLMKGKKPRKNAKIPDEELEWGFHLEGGASQSTNLTELTENSSLQSLPQKRRRVPRGEEHTVPSLLAVQGKEDWLPICDQGHSEHSQEHDHKQFELPGTLGWFRSFDSG